MADEVPLAVEDDGVGGEAEPGDGSSGRQLLGLGHSEPVTLLVAGVADGPGVAPVGHPLEQGLPLGFGQGLGVAELVDPPVLRHDGGADGERSGPGTAADLVDADHQVMAGIPQGAFLGQARRLGLDGLAKSGHGGRRHGDRT